MQDYVKPLPYMGAQTVKEQEVQELTADLSYLCLGPTPATFSEVK